MFGAVVSHAAEVATFEDAESLEGHGALGPGAAGVDVGALVVDGGRLVDADVESRQVVHGKEAALFLDEADDFLSDVAQVEQVAGGLDARLPVATGLLGFHHAPEGAGQVLLDEDVPGFQCASVPEEAGDGAGPLDGLPLIVDELGSLADEGVVEGFGNGEAALRDLQGRGHDLGKGHGAVEPEGGEPSIGGGGSDGAENAGRKLPIVVPVEVVDAGGLGPASQSADADDVPAGNVVDDDGGDSAETGVLGQDDVQSQSGGDSSVGGVAALFQDTEAGGGGEVVSGGRHVGGAGDERAVGPQA